MCRSIRPSWTFLLIFLTLDDFHDPKPGIWKIFLLPKWCIQGFTKRIKFHHCDKVSEVPTFSLELITLINFENFTKKYVEWKLFQTLESVHKCECFKSLQTFFTRSMRFHCVIFFLNSHLFSASETFYFTVIFFHPAIFFQSCHLFSRSESFYFVVISFHCAIFF